MGIGLGRRGGWGMVRWSRWFFLFFYSSFLTSCKKEIIMGSKKFFIMFLLFVSFFIVSVAHAGWHEWSQGVRNQAIVEATYKYLNRYVGVSCKVWVQKVVREASNGVVDVPMTVDPPGWYWYSSKYVLGRSGRIENVMPGEIVQMDLTNYKDPHTAIVLARSPYSVTFVESNWCDKNCQIVRIRSVSFATFYSQVCGSNFTIYQIL
ncbi:MAG: hypothetical protein ABIC82_06805 [bacterium]